jgi:hypothetical protein
MDYLTAVVFQVTYKITGGDGIIKSLAVRIDKGAAYTIGVIIIRLHRIIPKFIRNIQKNEDRAGQTESKAKNIQQ